ncbi:MAG: hypothetical protein QF569_03660 [Candidatus Poribacteria bacterium]|nr:hypothetical protein [Candidatus Poribacteria bacterium]
MVSRGLTGKSGKKRQYLAQSIKCSKDPWHVETAWNIYKRSHDRDYPAQIYAVYRGLYGQQLDGEYDLGAEKWLEL